MIDKAYAASLQNKVEVFRRKTGTARQIFVAMIAANGLKKNRYSEELISSVVTAQDLIAVMQPKHR